MEVINATYSIKDFEFARGMESVQPVHMYPKPTLDMKGNVVEVQTNDDVHTTIDGIIEKLDELGGFVRELHSKVTRLNSKVFGIDRSLNCIRMDIKELQE